MPRSTSRLQLVGPNASPRCRPALRTCRQRGPSRSVVRPSSPAMAQPAPQARSPGRGPALHLAHTLDQGRRPHRRNNASRYCTTLLQLALSGSLSKNQPASSRVRPSCLGHGLSGSQLDLPGLGRPLTAWGKGGLRAPRHHPADTDRKRTLHASSPGDSLSFMNNPG